MGTDPSHAPEFPSAFECPKSFSRREAGQRRRHRRRHHIWQSLAKPKQARNFKNLKGLKWRYTLRYERSLADFAYMVSYLHATAKD
jgi:hypothetical protein